MSQLPPPAAYYADLLYGLLPEVYRGRDTHGELRRFLALFGHELGRLRGNLDQLRRDLFIESCQDWVVPYLADLVATDIVFNEAARNRADVRDTIRWRRQKGTLAGLEDVAAGISGRGALAVEMFERLIWTQQLGHRRPRALHTVHLADAAAVAKLGTPFEAACRTVDLRPPGARGGLHQLRNVAAFTWDLASHPRRGGDPAGAGGGRFRFHPLGRDVPLYAGGDRGGACAGAEADPARRADLCAAHADHLPIRGRDFRDHAERYFGQPPGFAVREDGILLCRTLDTAPSRSTTPAAGFAGLRPGRGIVAADPGLFAGASFRVEAVLLAAQTVVVNGVPSPVAYSPAAPFAVNFALAGFQGRLDTGAFAYTDGLPFRAGAPDFHRPFLLLAVRRTGADADFPECELVVQGAGGARLLAYLPALPGLPPGQPFHLYVADDGSTWFGRATHDAGAPDRNPDASGPGAFLARHLARGALGQVRPRPGRPLAFRRAVQRDLCCWDRPPQRPPQPGEVAFDPGRGRFLFPAGEEPAGEVTVDFRQALAGELGAGPFFRGALPQPTLTVSRSGAADHATIQAAIDAAPDGGAEAVVIQVQDSRTYHEDLAIAGRDFPGGLVIQAAPTEAPAVRAAAGDVLAVAADSTIGAPAAAGQPARGLVLDGLVLAGGDVSVRGAVHALSIRFCSLDPSTVALNYAPAAPVAEARLEIARTLAGAVAASAAVAAVSAEDSVLHHPAATALDPAGGAAVDAPSARARLERATVIGEVRADAVEASNALLLGAFQAAHPQAGCLRYTRWHPGSPAARTFRCTTAYPVFLSLVPGHPGYAALADNASEAVRRGGEEGGEIGAFHAAGAPWRSQNLRIKLDEYLPAGLQAVPVRVLPTPRFHGITR